MGKIVILTSQCMSFIDLVIRVDNWDEKFADVIETATRLWHESDLEFRNVIEKHLTDAGYIFVIIDDYMVIDDPGG